MYNNKIKNNYYFFFIFLFIFLFLILQLRFLKNADSDQWFNICLTKIDTIEYYLALYVCILTKNCSKHELYLRNDVRNELPNTTYTFTFKVK